MQDWEKALDTFITSWRDKDEVVGAMVCGSFVVGNPSSHSDIDVHILLKAGTPWRERGNHIVDGFLIEYFANPPQQIIEYFKEDFADRRPMAVTQFLTGHILFDDGTITRLKTEAERWHQKPFVPMSETVQSLQKYSIWDTLDNLQDAFERDAPHFLFIYHNALNELLQKYCHFIGYPAVDGYRAYEILTDAATCAKYLLPAFPDQDFQVQMVDALVEADKAGALSRFEALVDYVLGKMSGFDIDGWSLRTPVSY